MHSTYAAYVLIHGTASITGLFPSRWFFKVLKYWKWQFSIFQGSLLVSLAQSPGHQQSRLNQLEFSLCVIPAHTSNCICTLIHGHLLTRSSSFCLALLSFGLSLFCPFLFLSFFFFFWEFLFWQIHFCFAFSLIRNCCSLHCSDLQVLVKIKGDENIGMVCLRQTQIFNSNVVINFDHLPWWSQTGFILFYLIYSNSSVLLGKHVRTKSPSNNKICRTWASTNNVSSCDEDMAVYQDEQK